MQAKACILTHFSQRYQTLPREQDTESSEKAVSKVDQTIADMKVAFAFDLMRVKVGEMAEVPYFMKATEMLLAEEESDMPVA
ncbi:hypothetical protein MRB53_040021 [Persea americana]|nr:hypothetical protein MRB53_040021 [Persea americana]